MDNAFSYLKYSLKDCINPKESEVKLLDYTVKFKRFDSTVSFADSYSGGYIVECKFFNNIGSEIYSFRMNESDCLRLLENMSVFLYEFDYTGSSMFIELCLENNHQEYYPTIYLFKSSRCGEPEEFEQFGAWFYNKDNEEVRYIDFTLLNYRGNNQEDIILKIPLGATELESFIFELCMIIDADITFPPDFDLGYF